MTIAKIKYVYKLKYLTIANVETWIFFRNRQIHRNDGPAMYSKNSFYNKYYYKGNPISEEKWSTLEPKRHLKFIANKLKNLWEECESITSDKDIQIWFNKNIRYIRSLQNKFNHVRTKHNIPCYRTGSKYRYVYFPV